MKSRNECTSSTAFIRVRNFTDVLMLKGRGIKIISACVGTRACSDLLLPLCSMAA